MSKKDQELHDVHAEGKRRWEDFWAATYRENELALQDRRFVIVHGGQYEGNLGEEYQDRPKPEVNKCKMAQRKINSEYRKNPITADFIGRNGEIDDDLANQLDGAYRSDEQDYCGQEAYDACADEAFSGGKGAYRLRAVYEDEFDPENDSQRIAFEHIPDADVSVGFDLNAKRQDKGDAEWGGIVTAMTPEAYKEKYGEDPASWPRSYNTDYWDWWKPDLVYIFEYYRVEYGKRKLRVYQSIDNEEVRIFEDEIEEDPSKEIMLLATGHVHLPERDRSIKVREVYKYIMSGSKILEECGRVPGNVIPIVLQYGERYIIDGIERYNGFVRTLKDAQRIYNMLIGLLSEIAVNGTQELPIFAPDQMPEQLREFWANANREQYPFYLAEPLRDADGNIVSAGPMAFSKAPEVPPALAALINVVGGDIRELLGDNQSNQDLVSNISGKAVELIQQMQDLPNFIFLDNARKARKRGVEIWLEMAKELYVEKGRKLRTVGTEGDAGQIEIGRPKIMPDGAVGAEFDIQDSNIGVYADVGPASVSKKAAAAKEMLNALQIVQPGTEEHAILLASAFLNMEGEGIQEMRPYWRRKLVRMGVLEPTKEERQEMEQEAQAAAQEPNPESEFLLAEATKSQAQAQKAQADTALTLAKTEETQAKTAETLAGIDRDDREQALKAAEAINQAVAVPPRQTGEQIG